MTKRPFRDAPPHLRCEIRVTLKDGTHARCGRYRNEDYVRNLSVDRSICTQHAEMLLAGKPLITFWNGLPATPKKR